MMTNPDQSKPTNEGRSGLSQTTDQSLLRRFRDGSDDAATALYIRYAERLQRLADFQVSPQLAARIDPEEIVQSVFRTFFRLAGQGQYDVADREELWKLLLVMALNKIRTSGNFYNAAKRDSARTKPLPTASSDYSTVAESSVAYQVLKMTVEEVVAALPEEQQPIVCLRIDGFELDEIAEKTGRSKRSIERILQSFRRRLQESLGDPS